MKVEVDVPKKPTVSVDIKQHFNQLTFSVQFDLFYLLDQPCFEKESSFKADIKSNKVMRL